MRSARLSLALHILGSADNSWRELHYISIVIENLGSGASWWCWSLHHRQLIKKIGVLLLSKERITGTISRKKPFLIPLKTNWSDDMDPFLRNSLRYHRCDRTTVSEVPHLNYRSDQAETAQVSDLLTISMHCSIQMAWCRPKCTSRVPEPVGQIVESCRCGIDP